MKNFDNIKKQFLDLNLKNVEHAYLLTIDYNNKNRTISLSTLAYKNNDLNQIETEPTIIDFIFSAKNIESKISAKISNDLIERSFTKASADANIEIDVMDVDDGMIILNVDKQQSLDFTKSFYHHLFLELGDSSFSKIVSSKEFFENYEQD